MNYDRTIRENLLREYLFIAREHQAQHYNVTFFL